MSLSGPYLFDPRAFWGDEDVQLMTVAQVYVYKRLIDRQWENGSIPADPLKLAALVTEGPRAFTAEDFVGRDGGAMGTLSAPYPGSLWGAIGDCFEELPGEPDRLVQMRMHDGREEWIEKQKKASEDGKRGAEKRWANRRKRRRRKTIEANDGQAIGSPSGSHGAPIANDGAPPNGISSSSSSSSSSRREEKDSAPKAPSDSLFPDLEDEEPKKKERFADEIGIVWRFFQDEALPKFKARCQLNGKVRFRERPPPNAKAAIVTALKNDYTVKDLEQAMANAVYHTWLRGDSAASAAPQVSLEKWLTIRPPSSSKPIDRVAELLELGSKKGSAFRYTSR